MVAIVAGGWEHTEEIAEDYTGRIIRSLGIRNETRLRAIHLLADFQTHQRVLIRRKRKRYEFTQPFENIFREFMEFRKNAGISSKTLESYTIYLERFSQYLFNHEVNHVTEIDVAHIHGFIQSCAAVYRIATIYCTSCLLRVLFRYLFDQKVTTKNLALAVPSVRCSKKSKLPSAYRKEEIRRLIECVDRGKPFSNLPGSRLRPTLLKARSLKTRQLRRPKPGLITRFGWGR